jgi:hypothetical protein
MNIFTQFQSAPYAKSEPPRYVFSFRRAPEQKLHHRSGPSHVDIVLVCIYSLLNGALLDLSTHIHEHYAFRTIPILFFWSLIHRLFGHMRQPNKRVIHVYSTSGTAKSI